MNRLLGGARLSRRALEHLVPRGSAVSLVDVGTGAADIPLTLLDRASRSTLDLSVVAVDSRPEVLAAARRLDERLSRDPRLALHVADGRALPFRDGAFDVAHASLVLHHLEPDEAVSFFSELSRVSRRGVVVNDLVRGWVWWAFAWLGSHLLTANPLTRNDAPLSVRRAYTPSEARDLLRRAGLKPVFQTLGLLGHRYAIAAVPASASVPVAPPSPTRAR